MALLLNIMKKVKNIQIKKPKILIMKKKMVIKKAKKKKKIKHLKIAKKN